MTRRCVTITNATTGTSYRSPSDSRTRSRYYNIFPPAAGQLSGVLFTSRLIYHSNRTAAAISI